MQTLRWLIGVAALTLVPGRPITAQDVVRRVGGASEVVAGDEVRVWMDPEFSFRLLPFRVGVYPVRFVATMAANWAPDSMRLHRTALILYPWESRHRTLFWGEVRRLDVADGRLGEAGAVGGAIAGFVVSVVAAGMYSFLSHVVCFDAICGPGFGKTLLVVAAVTVPTCAIWGARSTKWRKVY
jgi:hypothetical protein